MQEQDKNMKEGKKDTKGKKSSGWTFRTNSAWPENYPEDNRKDILPHSVYSHSVLLTKSYTHSCLLLLCCIMAGLSLCFINSLGFLN
jgi:hypothetical protein